MNTETTPERTEELLAAILKTQKKTARRAGITAFAHALLILVLLAVIAGGIFIVPRVMEIADRAKNVLVEAETLIAEVREIAGNTGTMVENANTVISEAGAMIEQNTGAVTEAVQKLNGVDFEKLNEAIRNLNDAVAPLGALARNLP